MELVLDLLGSSVLSRRRLESSKLEPTPESEQEMHRDLRLDRYTLSMLGGFMKGELDAFGMNMLVTVDGFEDVVMLSLDLLRV